MSAKYNFGRTASFLSVWTNVMILLTCFTFFVSVGKGLIKHRAQSATANSGLVRGAPAPQITGIEYTATRGTLLVFLNSSCQFCERSTPFYRKLAAAVNQSQGTKLVAIFPTDDMQASNFLHQNGIDVSQVRKEDFRRLTVVSTPTIIWVDDRGRVRDFWVGELSSTAQNSIINGV